MSALCGALWFEGHPTVGALRGVTDTLAPFGRPAIWSGAVGSGHAALCAVHPDAIAPTMTTSGIVVYADATLSGRHDIQQRLGADRAATDVELIGLAYDRWGRDMFEHLNGSFAVAIIDTVRCGLLLARDHVGSRFLAVHERPGVVAFSSTALSLTGFPGVGHELDIQRLAELAVAAYGPTRTFVRGVESIAPGCWRWIGPDERTRPPVVAARTSSSPRPWFGGGAHDRTSRSARKSGCQATRGSHRCRRVAQRWTRLRIGRRCCCGADVAPEAGLIHIGTPTGLVGHGPTWLDRR